MAEEMKGTNISSPVVPFTKDDKYATHDETFGRGGYRSVNSISEMNAIPSERRKEGMLVNVIGDKIYKLTNDSFVDAGLGSGGSGGGSSTSNVKVLTTPDLINPTRTTRLTLSEQDTYILNNLSPDDIVMYYGELGSSKLFVPISIYNAFPRIILGYLVSVAQNTVNLTYSSNTYVAQPPINVTSNKQDLLVSGTNIKTINGNSILGSGDIQITGGSGGGEVYVTSLNVQSIQDGTALTQAQYDELRVIYNKWKAGINVLSENNTQIASVNLWIPNKDIDKTHTLGISYINDIYEHILKVNPTKVGNTWHREVYARVMTVDLMNIYLEDGYSQILTPDTDDFLFLELKKLYEYSSSGIPIQVIGLNGENGIFPLEANSNSYIYYVRYDNREYRINLHLIDEYSIQYTVTEIAVKYDLSIEVKTASDGIYYRIKERVPNGYIQFVRKKRHKYYSSGIGRISRTGYSVLGLDFRNSVGVNAMTLTPNVWYKFPITKERLYNKYTQGSIIESLAGGIVRNYNTIRLCGNTHAKPIKYGDNGTVYNLRKTSVLHAGLQYNVLHPDYVNKVSPKVIFKQRGEIVPIDVRMKVDPKSFSLDPVLYFAVQ